MSLWKNKSVLSAFIAVFFACYLNNEVHAQRVIYEEDNPPLSDRLYFGGNFSLQLGRITYIDISPLAGAMITEKYSAGVGATYQYYNNKNYIDGMSHVYGGRIFNRYNIFRQIFLHAEYESLNLEVPYLDSNNEVTYYREWVPALFGGAGYFVPFGVRGGMNIMALYNFSYDNKRSNYNEPYVFRVGFVF
ncbi:hypothetical protein [Cyclobacterium marinum]|uniref:Uncharacterized protein n=1 Tax=Cyclobacterium marinum (strain ATCC 25205 / DSM 745 / LMG 13164 / NCIMB 1802) TaxID=880070 RepID=G0IXD5_CYCMS|nr:hypothetical protein [Cyclobacterium marinum]AEL26360.1 hypothetical protein Cycma_2621 [Cyclobacterium marinum DSM 745]